ncbi:neutral zinc metallopeptidase [Streptomonospora salina]|uniref:Putative metalloprotease n=1 Tax=Streptomonospora salina TaxID=104205 RepID=A0A841E9J8_9ACTN|nr:neutral zinc metallopeptidase [Streptomonospora salina]MBB5999134.1 putative metalloprotease [Streptomonospora salina]
MAQRTARTGPAADARGTRRRPGTGSYPLPSYARRPRQRLGLGVTLVLLTGLTAMGFAAFVSVSALSGPSGAGPAPQGPGAAPMAGGEPAPQDSGTGALAADPLYSSGEMSQVTCPAPRLDADDPASMENFLHEITGCLDTAWSEQLADSGVEFDPPNRIYWYTAGQSPCGTYPAAGSSAFYCQANEGLYLGIQDIVETSAKSNHPERYTFLLSHEYAHHVQGEAGVLSRFHSVRAGEGDDAAKDGLTRRNELQANCLGGLFLGSVSDSYPIDAQEHANILADAERRADPPRGDRTHGSPDNGRMWTDHGMDRGDPAACNTWQARKELVE